MALTLLSGLMHILTKTTIDDYCMYAVKLKTHIVWYKDNSVHMPKKPASIFIKTLYQRY